MKVGAEVRVGSQLSGIVKKLNVTVGSQIKKGDVIAEIDSTGLQARIEDAKAQIRIDEVELEKSRRDLARDQQLIDSVQAYCPGKTSKMFRPRSGQTRQNSTSLRATWQSLKSILPT
ncbi:MAG TPA: biotin/lipoyl-binding protein [Blastocatellia bacterium]|nr:biotin/lipoyl-binding protein [Blastocatellia bacterium]